MYYSIFCIFVLILPVVLELRKQFQQPIMSEPQGLGIPASCRNPKIHPKSQGHQEGQDNAGARERTTHVTLLPRRSLGSLVPRSCIVAGMPDCRRDDWPGGVAEQRHWDGCRQPQQRKYWCDVERKCRKLTRIIMIIRLGG